MITNFTTQLGKHKKVIFSKEQEDFIVDMYMNHEMSTVKIGKLFKVSHKTIAAILEKHNIKRIGVGQRKYKLNEYYFDNIDSPNKAYFLGLLYADGSNFPPKQTISIALQEEDKDILEKMRLDIESEKELDYLDYSHKHDFGYTYKNQYRLSMYSSHMCKTLSNIGMIQNKSLLLEFPEIDESLYRFFILGYFDGDGCLCEYVKNENNKQIICTITSTITFCNKVKEIIEKEVGIHVGIYEAACKNGITKVVSIGGRNNSKKFLDWLYKDATIFMQRKYNRYVKYYNLNESSVA